MKRYSIVRVDGVCPIYNDKNFNRKSKNFCYRFNCSNCLYGDTKEQLIKKVAQAIQRKLKGGLILRNTKINETYNIQKSISIKVVAKEIVEFLGVK